MRFLMNKMASNRTPLLYSLLAIQLALYFWLFWPGHSQPHIQRFIFVAIGLSACWILTLFVLGAGGARRKIGGALLITGLVAGAVFRVVVVSGAGEQTYLSDDVYRYVWDGRLLSHGLNPFATAPEDVFYSPAVTSLIDDNIHPRVNHPSFPSIYPPISQYLFYLADILSDSTIYGFKIVSLLFDLLTLGALCALLKAYKFPTWYVLIYWLAPLVILEFSLSSHQDILLLPFLTLALLFQNRKNALATALFLTLATLTKFIVALTLPALLLSFVGRERLKFALTVVVVSALAYAPFWFLLSPPELFGSLFDYLSQWQYNGSLYTALERALSLATENSAALARGVVAGALLITLGVITLKVRDKVKAAYLCLLAYAALTTTLFPWYLVVFFPFITLYRGAAVISLISLVWFSYWGLIGQLETGFWYDNWWLRTLEYIPFYLFLVIGLKRDILGLREEHRFAL